MIYEFQQKVERVFLEAMVNGWANPEVKKVPLPGLPGSKAIRFRKEGLFVLDYYFSNPESGRSMGNTVILEGKTPVWMMSYGGHYPKEVVPFLKEALLVNYKAKVFVGARGPHFFENDTYAYVNTVMRGDFESFFGEEKIIHRESGRSLGHHTYFGKSLK